MTRYFFDLSNDGGTAVDDVGNVFSDSASALTYGQQIARELARNNGPESRTFCISVRDESGRVLSIVPFADVDETLRQLPSETQALLRICFERRRNLSDAIRAAREAIRQSRATVARSRGKPYLAVTNGQRSR